jgi:hypothetical protein
MGYESRKFRKTDDNDGFKRSLFEPSAQRSSKLSSQQQADLLTLPSIYKLSKPNTTMSAIDKKNSKQHLQLAYSKPKDSIKQKAPTKTPTDTTTMTYKNTMAESTL